MTGNKYESRESIKKNVMLYSACHGWYCREIIYTHENPVRSSNKRIIDGVECENPIFIKTQLAGKSPPINPDMLLIRKMSDESYITVFLKIKPSEKDAERIKNQLRVIGTTYNSDNYQVINSTHDALEALGFWSEDKED